MNNNDNPNDNEIMIISQSMKYKQTPNETVISRLIESLPNTSSIKIDVNGLSLPQYISISENELISNLHQLESVMKKLKIRISGEMIYVRPVNMTYCQIKFTGIRIRIIDCKVKIVAQINEPKKRTKGLNIDDKLKLFKIYVEKYKKLPKNNEIYEDFSIGKFYTSVMKNKDTLIQIESICNELDINESCVSE